VRLVFVRLAMLVLAAPGGISAKGPTRKVIITGAPLAGQVELTDPALLAMSNVYLGNFLSAGGFTAAPSASMPRYEISFYLLDRDTGLLAPLPARRRRLQRATTMGRWWCIYG
jgi:hypothetical protein